VVEAQYCYTGRRRAATAGARMFIEWDDEEGVAAIAAATSSEDDGDFVGGGSGGRGDCVAGRGGGPTFDLCSRGLLSLPLSFLCTRVTREASASRLSGEAVAPPQ